MDPLPPAKFQARPWRYNRKRRRSGTEAGDAAEADGKISKKENDTSAAAATTSATEKMDTDTK